VSAAPRAVRIHGIDEPLPASERLLWQGAPDWRSLARRRFHARKIAVYFGLLIAWRAASAIPEPEPLTYFAVGALWLLVLGALGVGALYLFAWLVARTTTYAVTSRRVVMRVGVALPAVLNIPLHLVSSASSRPHADGTGTLVLDLDEENRLAWILLWPHNRPLRFRNPEPALLCVPEAEAVGAALREALIADSAAVEAESISAPAEPSRGPARPQLSLAR
jgi:hypothetical protein